MSGKYRLVITTAAQRDKDTIKPNPALKPTVQKQPELICENPSQNPPPYERLLGKLKQCYSRRINAQHRLVYMVYEEERVIKIISMWSHYEF